MSRLCISTIRMTAIDAEQHTDARVPMPSQTGLPVSIVSPTPASANTRPISAPVSSSSTTGSSGLREVRMNRHQLPIP